MEMEMEMEKGIKLGPIVGMLDRLWFCGSLLK